MNGKEIDDKTFLNRYDSSEYPINNKKFQKQSRSLLIKCKKIL